jgi:hypothetical protein
LEQGATLHRRFGDSVEPDPERLPGARIKIEQSGGLINKPIKNKK